MFLSVDALDTEKTANSPLQPAFLKWQCRVRQSAMRHHSGRPDDGIMPALYLPDQSESLGHIITQINKLPDYSVTPELSHIIASDNDPSRQREKAIRFLSAAYYQKANEFSDTLSATFPPDSPGAAKIREKSYCTLVFDAFGHLFRLHCSTAVLPKENPLHQATIIHNRLFNPVWLPGTIVLGFTPDWSVSTSHPEYR
jgi:hypothetical protein